MSFALRSVSYTHLDVYKRQPEDYDPQLALEEELTRQQRLEDVAELQAQLDDAYEKEREEALYQPPPLIIRAYQTVYGHFAEGRVE